MLSLDKYLVKVIFNISTIISTTLDDPLKNLFGSLKTHTVDKSHFNSLITLTTLIVRINLIHQRCFSCPRRPTDIQKRTFPDRSKVITEKGFDFRSFRSSGNDFI